VEFSQNVASLEPSATLALAARARQMREEGRSVVDLSAGEPVWGTPEYASEGGIRAIRAGKTGYPPTPGIPELRRAVARYTAATTGAPEPAADRVLVGAGVKQALFNCVFTLFGPDDEVIVPAPYWTSYLPQIRLARAEPVVVRTRWEDGFRLDLDELERVRSPRTRGLILNSPGNPTGSVYGEELLEEVAGWAERHGIWLLADEIYRRMHFGEGPAPSLLDLPERPERSVVVDGVSKAFSMTGWRVGWALGPAELISEASDLQSQTTSGAAAPSQYAAAAALERAEEREAAIAEARERLIRRRDRLAAALEGLEALEVRRPGGGMFLFVRLAEDRDSARTAEALLEEAGVAVVPGDAFGAPGHLRFNFAVAPESLEEGARRVRDWFAAG